MMRTTKRAYTPPRVLKETEVFSERNLMLSGSVTDNLNLGGIYTTPQTVEQVDVESDDFNFRWE